MTGAPSHRFHWLHRTFDCGRVLGIRLRIHWVFVALFALLLAQALIASGVDFALWFARRFALLFGCVLAHELGHSLVARAFGVRVHDIVLWPLGGMARLERSPETTGFELAIAAAGPAINLALAALLFALRAAVVPGDALAFLHAPPLEWTPLEYLILVNVAMGVLNLLPAFPLDGGRMLRALLSRRMSHLQATRVAVVLGRALALAAVAVAATAHHEIGAALLALFVWFAGAQELRVAAGRSA